MAAIKLFYFAIVILFSTNKVESASFFESSYNYVKSLAPNLMSVLDCVRDNDVWGCAKFRAGRLFDRFDDDLNRQRQLWQEAADAEVASSGRSLEQPPSQLGREVESSLLAIADVMQHGVARALARKKHDSDGGGIDSITISASSDKKMKTKKKKQKPPRIHLVHPVVMMKNQEKGRGFPTGKVQSWVIGHEWNLDENVDGRTHAENSTPGLENGRGFSGSSGDSAGNAGGSSGNAGDSSGNALGSSGNAGGPSGNAGDSSGNAGGPSGNAGGPSGNAGGPSGNAGGPSGNLSVGVRKGRDLMGDIWAAGNKALDAVADYAMESDNAENGVADKSSLSEQRGKKKKKKKAILKLLILGAVLKAKIGTLLQILSFKLQVKFFIVAVIGLAINLARFWLDLKKQHSQQPQKVIYYEHAQHQHHYEHEEEPSSWGPWSRSIDPEESDVTLDADLQNSPYRGHERSQAFSEPRRIQ